jgi:tetratricopeptide (TPR) repeat protein
MVRRCCRAIPTEATGGWRLRPGRYRLGHIVVGPGVFAIILVFAHGCLPAAFGQAPSQRATSKSVFQHYDLAESAQTAGDFNRAEFEYELFLADALHSLANGRANAKDFARALPWYEEALRLSPRDAKLCLDYAGASLAAGDVLKAKQVAHLAVDNDPKNAKAHLLLGQILLRLKENHDAKTQLEAAVALDPNFEDGYALATADLELNDNPGAAKIFHEMLAGFGDTAAIRMQIGRAYALSGLPDQAVPQFQKALAKDGHLRGAHYSLGAAYMQSAGEAMYPDAVLEFQKELRLNPDDFLSHLELGYIARNRHELAEAEKQLAKATDLNPGYPESYLYLGQLYSEMERWTEAEAALRKAILLTRDDSESHYQIQSAHYLLGRILLRSGREEEAKKEMRIAQRLQRLGSLENQGKAVDRSNQGMGADLRKNNDDGTNPSPTIPDPQALQAIQAFEKEMAPIIADSYDNLGAIAAENSDFTNASNSFEKASVWNPTLAGLDFNWGNAAFSAKRYDQAIPPLTRYLTSHPDDKWSREALGTSYYVLNNYSQALQIWQPVEDRLISTPQLAYAYAVCLVKAGDYDKGVQLLQRLEKTDGGVAAVHIALGDAYVSHRNFDGASAEFRQAVQLVPTNSDAKLGLALSLAELGRWEESQDILLDLVRSGSKNSDVYFELGKLQEAHEHVRDAIANLEIAAQLNPHNGRIHSELAAAYLKDSRPQDAERENRLSEAIQNAPNAEDGPRLK